MTSTNIFPTPAPLTLKYDGTLANVGATDTRVVVQDTYTVLSAHQVQSVVISEVAPVSAELPTPHRHLIITTANGSRITVDLYGVTDEALTITAEVGKW